MNSEQLHITVSTELKALIQAAAQNRFPAFSGRSLATWCRQVLEQAATAELNKEQ